MRFTLSNAKIYSRIISLLHCPIYIFCQPFYTLKYSKPEKDYSWWIKDLHCYFPGSNFDSATSLFLKCQLLMFLVLIFFFPFLDGKVEFAWLISQFMITDFFLQIKMHTEVIRLKYTRSSLIKVWGREWETQNPWKEPLKKVRFENHCRAWSVALLALLTSRESKLYGEYVRISFRQCALKSITRRQE